ncbi:glycosyltransferase family 4 protein [Exiguobacterium sp.]|uniref:glycosyltransferase family 4 protein n=1 Tax=Exiguobacterium sp. TaxID=44751 RepID=UPI0025BF4BB2|nr:glycosyltransferase family 4 protein [Exiguobacterium sp.]
MKVILLAPKPPPAGGIAGWTMRMEKAKLINNWKVEVVDEKLIGKREVFGEQSKKSIYNETKRTLKIWLNLFLKARDKEVKVVHSSIPATRMAMTRELICCYISKVMRKKFIIHYRCTVPYMCTKKIDIFLMKKLSNASDKVFCLNKESQKFIENNTKTESVLIPNFIDEESIIQHEVVINKNIKNVIYVGGVIKSKGAVDILKVAEKLPYIDFTLIGKASKEIFDMKKTDNITILGEIPLNEVTGELDKADVFLFPSYFEGEGFSNALAEAMARGLPCIVSDWAANSDMIEKNGGIVVDIKKPDQIVKAILHLEKNPQKRVENSAFNINKVKNNYIDRIVTSMYVKEYEKTIQS